MASTQPTWKPELMTGITGAMWWGTRAPGLPILWHASTPYAVASTIAKRWNTNWRAKVFMGNTMPQLPIAAQLSWSKSFMDICRVLLAYFGMPDSAAGTNDFYDVFDIAAGKLSYASYAKIIWLAYYAPDDKSQYKPDSIPPPVRPQDIVAPDNTILQLGDPISTPIREEDRTQVLVWSDGDTIPDEITSIHWQLMGRVPSASPPSTPTSPPDTIVPSPSDPGVIQTTPVSSGPSMIVLVGGVAAVATLSYLVWHIATSKKR